MSHPDLNDNREERFNSKSDEEHSLPLFAALIIVRKLCLFG